MKRICAWCKVDLGGQGDDVTHGICPSCYEDMTREICKLGVCVDVKGSCLMCDGQGVCEHCGKEASWIDRLIA